MAKSKQCNYCPEQITFERVNDRWVPYNIDGTAHKCGAGARDERPKQKYVEVPDVPAEVVLPKAKPRVTELPTPTMGDIVLSKLDTIIFLLTVIKENL